MQWPKIDLREVASRVQRPETPQPGRLYRQIGVRLWGKGAYQRETIDGSETKYSVLYQTQKDDIIVNKIWARNGAIAVVSDDLDSSFGSSEFPTYEVDKSVLLPEWLGWFTKTSDLWAQCENVSRGTSGQNRLRPERFLDVQVPLPPMKEQRRIVARLDRVAALVGERQRNVEAAERESRALLLKAFERVIEGAPCRPMAEVAPLVRRPVDVQPDRSYPELGVRSFGRGTFHKPELVGSELTWQKLFRVQEGDLVFSNIKAWEGAFAVAEAEDHDRVGSHRHLTCVPKKHIVSASFIWFYLQTREGLNKIGDASPGSADRNRTLGLKKLAAIEVPVPPLDRQLWFDRLQRQVQEIEAMHKSTAQDAVSLVPALLHREFGVEACST